MLDFLTHTSRFEPLSAGEHPINVLTRIMRAFPHIQRSWFECSVYHYGEAYGVENERRVMPFESSDFGLDVPVRDLNENEELALNSAVRVAGKLIGHIPMIDFGDAELSGEGKEKLANLVLRVTGDDDVPVYLFSSGQSLHGYVPVVLDDEKAWHRWLGGLLLLNSDEEQVVDARWVGHCLIRGYSSLRWTKNTERYRAVPSYIAMVAP